MGNVLRILKRDTLRLLKAPAALVVALALVVLPSLYTWYNVVAFWNPYEATGNMTVYVVNQDKGTVNDLAGEIDIGARVTEELQKMDKLNFVVSDMDTAMTDLEAGKVYAVYVFPEDFSECLISPLSGTIKKPTVQYYTNEKLGPVSPKVTDTAAGTLQKTINSTFVKTVSDAVVQGIDDGLDNAAAGASKARSVASERMRAAMGAMSQVRSNLQDAQAATGDAQAKINAAASSMDDISATIADARTVVNDIESEADAIEAELMDVTSDASSALSGIIADISHVEANVDVLADDLSSLTAEGRSRASSALNRLESAADTLERLSSDVERIANALPQSWLESGSVSRVFTTDDGGQYAVGSLDVLEDSLETEALSDVKADVEAAESKASVKSRLLAISRKLGDKASRLRTLVGNVKEIDSQLADLSTVASDAAGELKDSAQHVVDAFQGYTDGLFDTMVPSVISIRNQVHAACARVSDSLTSLDATVKQAQSTMRHLADLSGDCGEALAETDKLVGGIQDDLSSLVSDVRLLASSGALAKFLNNTDLDAETIGAFLGSPTTVEKVELFHPNAYGSAMAPFFMNLTFWIGAFMLVIIFRLEVDDEGIKRVTLGQRYLARFLLFSGLAVAQALVCCVGVLALGVQVANVPAFFFGSALSSLAFLSIIYALSTTLQHIGKALCIILVFAQIPGGSGLYPLELTDDFFQLIYPFLPFSYGIDVLREAIFGFYGNFYMRDMIVLALLFVGMLVLGRVLVPLMSNVTRMAARQIREGGLYNGEEAVVPARPYRLSQVISVLSDREDFRESLQRRYARFSRIYRILIRAAIVLGIGVPVVLMLCMALDAGEKVVLLTIFLIWLVSLVVFLLIVESLRYSFERQLNIDRMSDTHLMKLFFERDRMKPALAHISRGATDSVESLGNESGESHDVEEAHDA